MKKLFSLLLILLFVFILTGCGKSKIQDLSQDKLLSTEGRYYVYFYREDCPGCQEVQPVIEQYVDALSDQRFAGKRKLYGFNISDGNKNSVIYRVYTGDDGQGTDGKFFVNGVTKWSDLYIASTPALISVTVENGVSTVRYEAQGAQNVTQTIANQLGVDYTTPENQ